MTWNSESVFNWNKRIYFSQVIQESGSSHGYGGGYSAPQQAPVKVVKVILQKSQGGHGHGGHGGHGGYSAPAPQPIKIIKVNILSSKLIHEN